jgi:hypothetical protein
MGFDGDVFMLLVLFSFFSAFLFYLITILTAWDLVLTQLSVLLLLPLDFLACGWPEEDILKN